jgi:hypothetical protein
MNNNEGLIGLLCVVLLTIMGTLATVEAVYRRAENEKWQKTVEMLQIEKEAYERAIKDVMR